MPRRLLLAACLLLCGIGVAQAQVVNPTVVQFTISADDATVIRYDLQFYLTSAPTVIVRTVNLGKPTPVAGVDTVDFSVLTTYPLPDGTYQARVVAVGSSGSGTSDPSNVFTFLASYPPTTCTGFTLSGATFTPSFAAGSSGITLTGTPSGCTGGTWATTGNGSWLTVAPTSGTGAGTVTVSWTQNGTTSSRVGTATVAGTTVTVTQAAPPTCTSFTSTPTSANPTASSGSQVVTITGSPTSCQGGSWTASGNGSWLTVSATSGTGPGTVTVSWTANTAYTDRTSTALVAGTTITVTQAAAVRPTCTSFAISPTSASPLSSSGSQTVTLTGSPANCAGGSWTATGNGSWLTVSAGSGNGPGSVTVLWTANTSTSSRTATATLAGQTFSVTQAGAPPPTCTSFTVSPNSVSPSSSAGSFLLTLTGIPSGCTNGAWTATGNGTWISVTPTSGSGSGTVTISWTQNTESSARSSSAAVAGHAITINQAVAPPPNCTYTLSTTAVSAGYGGASSGVTVTANLTSCAWTAMSDSAWVVPSPTSGTGSGSVTLTIGANTGALRTAIITLAGQTVTVTQAAAPPPCTYGIAPTSWTVAASGGSTAVAISASTPTCGWTATSDAGWVTVSPASGSGTGTVTATASANAGAGRTAILTIAGSTVTVIQAAVACTYTLSPTLLSMTATGGSANVTVMTNLGTCAWTVTNPVSWLTVTPTSGTGTGSVSVTLSPNTGTTRQATVVIGWQSLGVSQAGVPGQPPQPAANVIIVRH